MSGVDQTAPLPPGDTAPGAAGAPITPGRVGPYELVRELARGGMGVVHVARRAGTERLVALKRLHDSEGSPEALERFQLEGRVAARLKHPAIVPVHDVGVDERGRPWLVMDLIEGRSLRQRIASEGPLPAREAAELLAQAAGGVGWAHAAGVLHRDLKPHNILLARGADGRERALVTDFGLAKEVREDGGATRTGQVMGTPGYMPPEQAEGRHELVDRRADVYALGATLYEALAGRPPFQGKSVAEVLRAVVADEPLPPSALWPGVPRDLETICLACLEKEPLRRYPTAQTLKEDLERFMGDGRILARRPGLRRWVADRVQRHRPAVKVGAVCLALGVGALGVVELERRRDARWRLEELEDAARQALHHDQRPTRADDDVGHDAFIGERLDGLQKAEAWVAADPGSESARTTAATAASLLGGAANHADQWSLAIYAYRRAREHGDLDAEARLAEVAARRLGPHAGHVRAVERWLDEARQGRLDPGALPHAARTLAAVPHAECVARLAKVVRARAEALAALTRRHFLAAGDGDPAVAEALDTWLHELGKGTGSRGPAPPRGYGRLSVRDRRALGLDGQGFERLRAAQAAGESPGERAEVQLACEALAEMGQTDRDAVGALGAYALVQADPQLRRVATRALEALSGAQAFGWLDRVADLHGER